VNQYHLSLFVCVPLLAAMCTDPGVDYNHLLDLVVLLVVVTGCLWSAVPMEEEYRDALRAVFAVALGWVLFASWVTALEPKLREIGYGSAVNPNLYPAVPLVNYVSAGEKILTENPWLDVSRGQTPFVLDPFSFAKMTQDNPMLAEPLLTRIREGVFSKIILRHRLGESSDTMEKWEEVTYGRRVLSLIEDRYRLQNEEQGFFIYVPRR